MIRQTIGSAGNSVTENGMLVRQTIGQPSGTTLISRNSYILRQGFQQPLSLSSTTTEHTLPGFTISPNPASSRTMITLKEGPGVSFAVILTGLNGIVLRKTAAVNMDRMWLDLADIPSGTYIVTIKTTDKRAASGRLVVTDSGSQ
ncbi:MAG: T9SS type A sorting domain-containing protein [Bacteroidales bacterium]|nr:T9SS type A sorting domain-containing protein [Bacteroidales bacterium]